MSALDLRWSREYTALHAAAVVLLDDIRMQPFTWNRSPLQYVHGTGDHNALVMKALT